MLKNTEIVRTLIQNPDSLVLEILFDDNSRELVPFRCNAAEDPSILESLREFFAMIGPDLDQAAVQGPSMEAEFPACLRCPIFFQVMENILPQGKKPVGVNVRNTWSRDILTHDDAREHLLGKDAIFSTASAN